MNEDKASYHPLVVTVLLICAGLSSHFDSVEERTFKTSLEMISFMFIALFAGVSSFLICKLVEYSKSFTDTNS